MPAYVMSEFGPKSRSFQRGSKEMRLAGCSPVFLSGEQSGSSVLKQDLHTMVQFLSNEFSHYPWHTENYTR